VIGEIILKILVPHEGSAISDRAFKRAILFAKKLDYEVILLHIIDLKLFQSDSILKHIPEKSALDKAKTQLLKYLKMANESMLKRRVQEAKKQGVKVRSTVVIGSTPDGIVKVARIEKVDFIIIGSRGLSIEDNRPNTLRILGSIAKRVSELSDCPVMIVK
jgi:nucleotide-binding universal stress UspA family protein